VAFGFVPAPMKRSTSNLARPQRQQCRRPLSCWQGRFSADGRVEIVRFPSDRRHARLGLPKNATFWLSTQAAGMTWICGAKVSNLFQNLRCMLRSSALDATWVDHHSLVCRCRRRHSLDQFSPKPVVVETGYPLFFLFFFFFFFSCRLLLTWKVASRLSVKLRRSL
jgi:hypothetical protein